MTEAFISWSGGKDSCLAYYRAIQEGINGRYLLNMLTENAERSRTHSIHTKWLDLQSQAVGIPMQHRQTSWSDYETEFKEALQAYKKEGIHTGIFGDMDLEEHRKWVERVCSECDVVPLLPLWGENQETVLREFINAGFIAVVVAAKAELLGEEWLGRTINLGFMADLAKSNRDITLCGEKGEYHTFVIDGPLFKEKINITETKKVLRDDHWFLEINKCELLPK
ncbi:diphthine--ammonia ligase [Chloroflexota bacterium]